MPIKHRRPIPYGRPQNAKDMALASEFIHAFLLRVRRCCLLVYAWSGLGHLSTLRKLAHACAQVYVRMLLLTGVSVCCCLGVLLPILFPPSSSRFPPPRPPPPPASALWETKIAAISRCLSSCDAMIGVCKDRPAKTEATYGHLLAEFPPLIQTI